MKLSIIDQVLADVAAKRPVVVATDLESGEATLIHPFDDESGVADTELIDAARSMLISDKSGVFETEGRQLFLNTYNAPLRLILVGAVHIAQPLSQMATLAGYDVTIIDPRSAFATTERFPGVTLLNDWPDEGVAGLGPDHRTAIVTLTHDPKLDDPALDAALKTDCFYIGSLGSKKTHGARLERLKRMGHDTHTFDRIHGPVGLAIGAKTPPEIAVAILAQMTDALRKGPKS